MPANPLAPFLAAWQKRAAQAQQAGVSTQALEPIFQMDLKRLQQGTTPLTNPEADAAVLAAAGSPPVQKTGGTKPDWNPLHLLGGIGKDVGTTLKELPRIPGAVAKDLSHIGQMPGQIAKGAGEIASGNIGHGLEDIARAPGLQSLLLAADFVPGVDEFTLPATAAVMAAGEAGKALTPEGRLEISQHPGNTILNLLPAAKELDFIGGVSKVANLSDAEKARVLSGGMSEEELASKTMVRVPGKVRAALQQTPAYQTAAEKLAGKGMGSDMRAMLTAHYVLTKELGANMDEFAAQHGIGEWAQLDPETRSAITQQAGVFRNQGETVEQTLAKAGVAPADIARLAPAVTPMIDYIGQRGQELVSQGHFMQVPLPEEMGGGFEIYNPKDIVAQKYAALDGVAQEHVNALQSLQGARDRFEAAGNAPDLNKLTTDVQKLAQQDMEANGADGLIVRAQQDLSQGRLAYAATKLRQAGKDQPGLNAIADQLESLRDGKQMKARDNLNKAQAKVDTARTKYRKAQQSFHRELSRNPSPRYMPAIQDAYWKRMTADIGQGLYGPEGSPERQAAMDAVGAQFKDAKFTDGTPVFPQADKVLREVSKQWGQMRSDGLDPVFLHKMAGEFQAQSLPKINPGQLINPSALKQRALDVSGGYTDLGFGLVRSQAEFEADRLGRQIIEQHVIPNLTKDANETIQTLLDRKKAAGEQATWASVKSELERDHTTFDPRAFGVSGRIKGSTERIVTRDIQKQIDSLGGPGPSQNWLFRGMRKGTGVYIFAVTGLSPLHMAHVMMSNLFMGGTTDPAGMGMSAAQGWELMHNRGQYAGEVENLGLRNPSMMTESLQTLHEINGSAAKSGIRLAVESKLPAMEKGLSAGEAAKHYALWFPQKLQDFQTKADEWMSSFARATNYVMQRKEGWDPEQAIREVGRVYATHADLNPFERNVMRSFAPFYSWCLDKDSECLTKRGWVRGEDLREDDTILSARSDGSLVWSAVLSIYRNHYEGPMHRLVSRNMDALVTPGHRFLLADGRLKPVEDLWQNDSIRLMGEGVDGPEVYSDAFVELVGWAVTEGHYKRGRGTTIEIAQKDATPTCEQIRLTLKRAGARWHEFNAGVGHRIRYFGVTGEISREIRRVAPRRVMSMEFLLSLSLAQKRLLLDVMIAADGSVAKRGRGDRPTFVQKDDAAMDAFVTLATLAGQMTNTRKKDSVVWASTLKSTTTVTKRNQHHAHEPYSGMVWCPETEYGTFVCRRNGKVHITGNSKHLIRFAMQYPLDHPVRAGIVSNFAQAQADDNTGLPQDYAQLFFLGHPDPVTGKQTAFDIRQMNPFRDVGRDFTWAGFVSQLHPAIGAALTSMGINTYSGSAELYPELTVDPNTGQLKAKGTSFAGNLAQEAVPQTKAIAGLLGWSDQMRQLQKTDPVAFRDSIARSFHFPWLPKSISIPQERGKMELNQIRVAQADVSNAMKTGDFSKLGQYDKVPFQGSFVTPQQLEALYSLLQSKNTGFTPNTLLRK